MAGKSAIRSSTRSTSKVVIGRSSSSQQPKDSRRKLLVFSALATALVVTALFLQLLSPPPVRAGYSGTVLMGDPIERITSRIEAPTARSWKYIFVHQSKTTYADTRSHGDEVGDHFVICNGAGAGDGDLMYSYRWREQQPAGAPEGASSIDADCISICLVGDMDRTKPSQAQIRRLSELISSLRGKYGIPANRVITSDAASPAGIGKKFPAEEFARQLRVER